jgi:hypothetical protein
LILLLVVREGSRKDMNIMKDMKVMKIMKDMKGMNIMKDMKVMNIMKDMKIMEPRKHVSLRFLIFVLNAALGSYFQSL